MRFSPLRLSPLRLSPMRFAALIVLATVAGPARAEEFDRFGLTASDAKRLTERAAARREALAEADKGAAAGELASLQSLLAAPPQPIGNARELAGEWRCRTIKVGGLLPLTPYGFFNCRITVSGEQARLVKITGSQRTQGDLIRYDRETFLYRGVNSTDFTKATRYGEDPDQDEIGLLYRLGRDRLRLETPWPMQESKYNVMEFVRRK